MSHDLFHTYMVLPSDTCVSFAAWNKQLLFYIEKQELGLFCYFRFPCCSCRSIGNSTEEAKRIETSKIFFFFLF